jgi:gamma-glutamylcyclotransferase (GGCT)/AIG2-like uncharacterized protein YtfP
VKEKQGRVVRASSSLFVYGSMVEAAHRTEIIGREVESIPATIEGYERGRKKHFYLRKCHGSRVDGLLLSGLRPADFEILDKYEEIPVLYTRELAEVVDERGVHVRCWVYVPTERVIAPD